MLDTILGIFNQFFTWIVSFLPRSPFRGFIDSIGEIPFLAELNWFLPISEVIVLLEAFLMVVSVYYVYSAILRFIRLIK